MHELQAAKTIEPVHGGPLTIRVRAPLTVDSGELVARAHILEYLADLVVSRHEFRRGKPRERAGELRKQMRVEALRFPLHKGPSVAVLPESIPAR